MFTVMTRTNEMVPFNDDYNVHNFTWGLDNFGPGSVSMGPNSKSIVVAARSSTE
jgi:hypothetical protein